MPLEEIMVQALPSAQREDPVEHEDVGMRGKLPRSYDIQLMTNNAMVRLSRIKLRNKEQTHEARFCIPDFTLRCIPTSLRPPQRQVWLRLWPLLVGQLRRIVAHLHTSVDNPDRQSIA